MNTAYKRRLSILICILVLLSSIANVSSPVKAVQIDTDTQSLSEIEFDYNDPSFIEIISDLGLIENYKDNDPVIKTYEFDSAYEFYPNENILDVQPLQLEFSPNKLHLLYFKSSNRIEAVLTLSAIDLIKSATATFTTTGPMGNRTETVHGDNSIPAGLIVLNWGFNGYNYPLYPQGQYVKVYGTITGVLGYGSFGPSTSGIQVG